MAEVDKVQVKRFLDTIGFLESSGGKNTNHRQIKKGIHRGHRAAGRYGLMPNTVQEIVTRAKLQKRMTPEMESLMEMDPAQIKETVENDPKLEQELAEILAEHVLKKSSGDENKAAYRWFMGHNLSDEKLRKRNYLDTDYVRKYQKHKEEKKMPNNRRKSTREELFGPDLTEVSEDILETGPITEPSQDYGLADQDGAMDVEALVARGGSREPQATDSRQRRMERVRDSFVNDRPKIDDLPGVDRIKNFLDRFRGNDNETLDRSQDLSMGPRVETPIPLPEEAPMSMPTAPQPENLDIRRRAMDLYGQEVAPGEDMIIDENDPRFQELKRRLR